MLVLKSRLKKGVGLHDSIHGFQGGWGVGTATPEAKLYQQLAGLAHETLFQVFIDVRKAYAPLDRGVCMDILKGYKLGPSMARLLGY